MSRRPLGQLEAEVLAALAAAGAPLSAGDVGGRLAGEPAYTTVNTILFRLYRKGMVTRRRDRRQFRYVLAVDESRLVANRMHQHLRHASDPHGVLAQFLQELSPEQENALRDLLDRARRPGEAAP
ncbi:BlaI/MecI/CopY family transcriptional regulator [Actinomadura atramentaria]|uniref:BlaI/MecI/CopY family transcriptional regulator n=1 Tax=Actinomadura atramentaria TaxID=1990 RepID=UPI00036CB026|nr:BlaI/MecI/CopY family transcriptional regulator [Actinomadura atramentaria]